MRSSFVMASAMALALACPIFAAHPASAQQQPPKQSSDVSQRNLTQAMRASDLIGKKARGSGGQDVGEIGDLLIGPSGQVSAAVIDVGGFLGMGEHSVAVDWNQISKSGDQVTVNMTKDQLRAAPEYVAPGKSAGGSSGYGSTPPK